MYLYMGIAFVIVDKEKANAIIGTCAAKIRAVRSIIKRLWRPYQNTSTEDEVDEERELGKIDYNYGNERA